MAELQTPRTPVPLSLRVGSFLLASLLTLLLVWLLGFALDDLRRMDGPEWTSVSAEFVDPALRERSTELRMQIGEIELAVQRQTELQGDLQRSMNNARDTMQQMMELQRLSLEKGEPPTEPEREALATSQQRFLEAQERYEAANTQIASANAERFRLRGELEQTNEEIKEQERPASTVYGRRKRNHEWRIAAARLGLIVPLFLLAAWLFRRLRSSGYRPIATAFLLATFWKVGTVMFDHFPQEYFKYIAIAAAIVIVLNFLLWVLRKATRPDRSLLLSRYREAYREHRCPVCSHPIARGPLRFARWTRRGPVLPPGSEAEGEAGTPYACPSCGTGLFGSCQSCGELRHELLPFCEHCGEEQPVPSGA